MGYEEFCVILCDFCVICRAQCIPLSSLPSDESCGPCRDPSQDDAQAARPFASGVAGKMGYEDFVWFILSKEDKGHDLSLMVVV